MFAQVALITYVIIDVILPVLVLAVCPNNTSSCANNVTSPADLCQTGNCTHRHHHYYNRENKERGVAVGVACAILLGVLGVIVVFMLVRNIRLDRRRGLDNSSYSYREERYI